MTPKQLHILQHSLGLDDCGRGRDYRNHFVTGEGSTDYPDCLALCELGLMKNHGGSELTGNMDCFSVTDAGRKAVRLESPKPPKVSRSRQRYLRWLGGPSCAMSFGEWLKHPECK